MLNIQRPVFGCCSIKKTYGGLLGGAVIVMATAIASSVSAEMELQDPTRPITYSEAAGVTPSALTLQAVFLRESGHQAVVNGRLVKVGDEVEGVRIKSIHRNKVFLVSGEKVRELELRPSILSTTETEG